VVVVLMFMICQLVKIKTVQDTGGRRIDVHDVKFKTLVVVVLKFMTSVSW